jgi:hypothetical protein
MGLFSSSEEKLMFCIAKLIHGQVICDYFNHFGQVAKWAFF